MNKFSQGLSKIPEIKQVTRYQKFYTSTLENGRKRTVQVTATHFLFKLIFHLPVRRF